MTSPTNARSRGNPTNVTIIGLGGIGSWLAEALVRYLAFRNDLPRPIRLRLIDGDRFEPHNRNRQRLHRYGNKAVVTAEALTALDLEPTLVPVPTYIDERTVGHHLCSGDTIFCCVDNHATRNIVSRHCATLERCLLISGGNGLRDGNVQAYLRADGQDITQPLTIHPEIAQPRDRLPNAPGCQGRMARQPQLLATNLMVATLMLSSYDRYQTGALLAGELFFDLDTIALRAALRPA